MDFSSVLIVSDYDLTLTDSSHQIPAANIRAIEEFTVNGGLFAVATGRGVINASNLAKSLPINAPCIFHNGAVIYDCGSKKVIRMITFDPSIRSRVRELIGHLYGICGVFIENIEGHFAPKELSYTYTYTPDDLRIIPFDEIPESWVMVVLIGSKEQVDAAQQIAEKLGFCGVRSLPYTYDLPADGVNKGNASRELLDLCGRKLLVCVGDAPNDIDMLKQADIAFVPENASEAMRSLGFRNAAHCDEGALADVIRQLNQMALGY